jgi:hypothetical protein
MNYLINFKLKVFMTLQDIYQILEATHLIKICQFFINPLIFQIKILREGYFYKSNMNHN